MSRIVIADQSIVFDGTSLERGALGGAETALIELAQALAARGHEVSVHNLCENAIDHRGVAWRRLQDGVPEAPDLFIANRGSQLLDFAPRARTTVFWTHNPATYMRKPRYQWAFLRRRPVIVFLGDSHAATYPWWGIDGGRKVIPYGISDRFLHATRRSPPAPRAVFTSNPQRSLDWLLQIWAERIHPAMPAAELHVFGGMGVYGSFGARKAAQMNAVFEQAKALAGKGVVLRGAVGKDQLVSELAAARCLLYRGDPGETFCLAAGEAQAMGVPAVVEAIGSLPERVRDGETGFIVDGQAAFADAALRLLRDDALWQRQHDAALATQRDLTWDRCAAGFEGLIR